MFKKKSNKCARCGKNISKDYDYCPYCGNSHKDDFNDERDYGMLGKKDMDEMDRFMQGGFNIKMPFGFNTLFNSLMKQIDRQMKDLDKQIGDEMKKPQSNGNIRRNGFSISISSAGDKPPVVRVKELGKPERVMKGGQVIKLGDNTKPKVVKEPKISEEKAKKIAKLPRQEAGTSVRRLSNKVIYEIDMPGVKSLEDVNIDKLENSIEIKSFSKDKVYVKLLPVNLPILSFDLKKDKLILELGLK